jgi:predicted nucleic acid-binding protein
MVLVDTPVWSLALRRKGNKRSPKEEKFSEALRDLIREGRAQMIGSVRQELLSGIREVQQFNRLRDGLRAFEEPTLQAKDYEDAAAMSNQCRAQGIAGSSIDFLICAVAHSRRWQILTTDGDFGHYAKILPVKLYPVP